MVGTYSQSDTNTYTESRANYVMGKVYEDTLNLYLAGLITKERADQIRRDLLYLMNKKALRYFQLQFFKPDGTEVGGLHYELKSDSSISGDAASGGLDFWGLPSNTRVTLLVDIDRSSSSIQEVDRQLNDWGWGTGQALTGAHEYLKSYSKEGYGVQQSIVGKW
ncbi:hypothetical protein WBJ53_32840 (plasmid) [Spirosoma sp. SC4-14]|uniref:HORMA-1 domain-containing protein n=1 Tax=Spirosoma sp. SC4-14 TaxID=3128900 RepID=UPI0030CE9F8B